MRRSAEPGRDCGVPPQHCAHLANCGRDRQHGWPHPRRSRRPALKAALASLRGVRTTGEMAPEIALDGQRPAEYVFSRHVEEAMDHLEQAGLGGGKRPAQSARRASQRAKGLPGFAGEPQ